MSSVLRIVIAPDKFAGTLTASEATEAISQGWRKVRPDDELVLCPIADGGEGTLTVLQDSIAGVRTEALLVTSALGTQIQAEYVTLSDGAVVVEAASACGISDVPMAQRNPAKLTSYGLGEIIASLAKDSRVVVTLGGSATVDGGVGMLQALGHQVLNRRGQPVSAGLEGLSQVHQVIPRPSIDPSHKISVAVDVDAPLLGTDGAVYRFGPQKGLAAEDLADADKVMRRFADIVAEVFSSDSRDMPGAGAAGGLGFALASFERARLVSGAAFLADMLGLPSAIHDADVVITGEGRVDRNTEAGKGPGYVADLARNAGVKTGVVAGSIEPGAATQFDETEELGPDGLTKAFECLVVSSERLAQRFSS